MQSVAVHCNAEEERLRTHQSKNPPPRKRSVGFDSKQQPADHQPHHKENIMSFHVSQSAEEPPIKTNAHHRRKLHREKMVVQSQPHHKFGEDGKSYSMSEMDPVLVIKAHAFVQHLLLKAVEEAQKRQNSETQALLPQASPLTSDSTRKETRKKRPILSFLHSEDESGSVGEGRNDVDNERHVEFIREAIRKQCRRAYRLFLSCLGRMP